MDVFNKLNEIGSVFQNSGLILSHLTEKGLFQVPDEGEYGQMCPRFSQNNKQSNPNEDAHATGQQHQKGCWRSP